MSETGKGQYVQTYIRVRQIQIQETNRIKSTDSHWNLETGSVTSQT